MQTLSEAKPATEMEQQRFRAKTHPAETGAETGRRRHGNGSGRLGGGEQRRFSQRGKRRRWALSLGGNGESRGTETSMLRRDEAQTLRRMRRSVSCKALCARKTEGEGCGDEVQT